MRIFDEPPPKSGSFCASRLCQRPILSNTFSNPDLGWLKTLGSKRSRCIFVRLSPRAIIWAIRQNQRCQGLHIFGGRTLIRNGAAERYLPALHGSSGLGYSCSAQQGMHSCPGESELCIFAIISAYLNIVCIEIAAQSSVRSLDQFPLSPRHRPRSAPRATRLGRRSADAHIKCGDRHRRRQRCVPWQCGTCMDHRHLHQ